MGKIPGDDFLVIVLSILLMIVTFRAGIKKKDNLIEKFLLAFSIGSLPLIFIIIIKSLMVPIINYIKC